METPLVNRIAKSKLITIDPGKFYPENVVLFDLKDFLFQELLLREKEFRQALDNYEWESLKNKDLLVFCSTDAIIPLWAYMLVASKAQPFVANIMVGKKDQIISTLIISEIKKSYPPETIDKGKFVIKGCSDVAIDPEVYSATTAYLVHHGARSVMFGEPCSTVPIYKRKKESL